MRVSYKGRDPHFKFRLAEIGYEEYEEHIVERIIKAMSIKGWDIDIVVAGQYASCQVEDYGEYKCFVKDYNAVKKSVKLWEKHGI